MILYLSDSTTVFEWNSSSRSYIAMSIKKHAVYIYVYSLTYPQIAKGISLPLSNNVVQPRADTPE